MAKYEITGPDGQVYEVEAPDSATEEEVLAYVQANTGGQPAAPQQPQSRGAPRDFMAGVNRSYAGLLGLPVDLATGAMNMLLPESHEIRNPIGGSESIRAGLGAAGIQTEGPRNFAGMAGEYLAPAPMVGAYGALKAGAGPAKNVAKEAISSILAAAGGYAGLQIAPGNPLAEMLGAITPAGVRGGLAATTKAGSRAGVSPAEIRANIATADRVGAPASPAATVPSKPVQALAAASSSGPGGVSVFKRAADTTAESLRARVSQIIGGEADDISRAGRKISSGLFGDSGFVSRFKAKSGSLYSAIDAKVPPGTPVPASSTYSYLSGANKGVPGAPAMSKRMFVDDALQSDADAFFNDIYANGGAIPYEALKRFRTRIGDALADPDLIGSEQRAQLKKLYGALSDDMKDVAVRNGAEREFKRANDYYAAGTKRIEDFFEPLDRKVTGEGIYKAVVGENPQSATQILTLKKSLAPDEWNYVRRTFITRMGKPAANAASEVGPGFSPQTFLTNYEKAKKNGVADAIFGTGQFRRDLDDIANYTSNVRSASEILANPSGSGARGLNASVLYYALGLPTAATVGAVTGGGASALAAAAGTGAVIAGATATNNRLAHALNSPAFANWLATATRIPEARLPGHMARLATIAQNNPEMASFLADYASAVSQLESQRSQTPVR